MIYFHWIYLLLDVVITVPAIITVLMDNRQPAKTMAWISVSYTHLFAQVVSACVANRANDVAVQLFNLLPFFQFLESCKQHLLSLLHIYTLV